MSNEGFALDLHVANSGSKSCNLVVDISHWTVVIFSKIIYKFDTQPNTKRMTRSWLTHNLLHLDDTAILVVWQTGCSVNAN